MGIIAKTGERVIVVDEKSGTPVVLMNLDEYETIVALAPRIPQAAPLSAPTPVSTVGMAHLTQNPGSGMIDPDLALFNENKKMPTGDWGGDEPEEDRYYMEPTE